MVRQAGRQDGKQAGCAVLVKSPLREGSCRQAGMLGGRRGSTPAAARRMPRCPPARASAGRLPWGSALPAAQGWRRLEMPQRRRRQQRLPPQRGMHAPSGSRPKQPRRRPAAARAAAAAALARAPGRQLPHTSSVRWWGRWQGTGRQRAWAAWGCHASCCRRGCCWRQAALMSAAPLPGPPAGLWRLAGMAIRKRGIACRQVATRLPALNVQLARRAAAHNGCAA